MKYLKTVYVHRYDEKENIWHKSEVKNVLVSGSNEAYNLSDTQNRDASITLRVMGDDNAEFFAQDVISFDTTDEDKPPENNIAVVVAVYKNSSGSKRLRHTKILCK